MPTEEINQAADAAQAPAASPAGRNVLNTLKGLFGKSGGPGAGGLGRIANIAGGGKAKAIIPIAIVLLILGGAIFFIITAVAVYASRLGAVPGYAGGIGMGNGQVICPSTSGWWAPEVLSVPDPKNGKLTKTIKAQFTGYHPKNRTITDAEDPNEGGAWAGPFNKIFLGIGAVAAPNTPDYPIGRTVIDIPGIGPRIVVDHGSMINKGGVTAGFTYDHFDIFDGWQTDGAKDGNKMVPEGVVDGVKIYVFDFSIEAAYQIVKNYPTQQACIAANAATTLAGGNITTTNFTSIGPDTPAGDFGTWKTWQDAAAVLGSTRSQISSQLTTVSFLGWNFTVHKKVAPYLEKAKADIQAAGGTSYRVTDPDSGGQIFRGNTNSPGSDSPHSFGSAIDINPNIHQNPNIKPRPSGCRPRDATCCPHDLPTVVSDALQKNGFFWGAKFNNVCDSMHFQFGGNYSTTGMHLPQ